MKLLTANFLTCAVKQCKTSPASFPLHFRDAELEQVEMDFNPLFLTNLLPRIHWDALKSAAAELGFTTLPENKPEFPALATKPNSKAPEDASEDEMETATSAPVDNTTSESPQDEQLLRDLHKLLLETQVVEGKLVCGNCGHEYRIKEGIANFLLPSHLV